MRNRFAALLVFLPSLSVYGQEKMALDANLAQQRLDVPIVKLSGSAPPVRGVVDGPARLDPSLILTIQRLGPKTVDAASSTGNELSYEARLTNSGNQPQEIPVNPERNKIFSACKLGYERQAMVSVTLINGGHEEQAASLTSVWSGCQNATQSVIRLLPGEWITYEDQYHYHPTDRPIP
jgi:hypothetical protein